MLAGGIFNTFQWVANFRTLPRPQPLRFNAVNKVLAVLAFSPANDERNGLTNCDCRA